MRAAFAKGKDRIINAYATESMLRYLPGTKARHTIKRPMQVEAIKTKSATDTFYEYTKEVIPRIEDSIERSLLKKYVSSLQSTHERNEVMQAYEQRKHELTLLTEKMVPKGEAGLSADIEDSSVTSVYDNIKIIKEKLTPERKQELRDTIYSNEGKGMSYHTYDTIGKYTLFPKAHWKRMFPRDSCGQFDKIDFKHSGVYGIMCTEESLKLTYDLSRKTLPSQRKIDYEYLIRNDVDTKELIKDEQTFVHMYQDF